jgi:hypothetical protein
VKRIGKCRFSGSRGGMVPAASLLSGADDEECGFF